MKSKCPYCNFGVNGLPEKRFRNQCSEIDSDNSPVFYTSFLAKFKESSKTVIVLQAPGAEYVVEYVDYCSWCGRRLEND